MKFELYKHLDNIRTILVCSNATPIRCRGGFSYSCWFCNSKYQNPDELKAHTLQTHDDTAKKTFMKDGSMINYVVKLDITGLQCSLCGKELNELDDLTTHIITNHGKLYHTDIKSHIIPFRFEANDFRCVICKNKFNNFKVLIEHMNAHYSNYICNICGAGFINKRTLQTHGYRHKTGTFGCSFCPKIFDTSIKKRDHERGVHILLNKRSKCGYCGEKFTDYTKKNDHLVKVHGAAPIVLQCQACEKTFGNQRSLTMHTKSYHLLQRKKPDRPA